jgi:hypothetical protein
MLGLRCALRTAEDLRNYPRSKIPELPSVEDLERSACAVKVCAACSAGARALWISGL